MLLLDADLALAKRLQLGGALEVICRSLELTDAQYETARKRYEGVGIWLDSDEAPLLRRLTIYLQGSTALGTTTRPIARNEHDVDLVAHISLLGPETPPATVKSAIGARLRRNPHYAPILTEKARCWRLSYANEFHMDITPSIPNAQCLRGGALVPDKDLSMWSPSNPKGYRALFERRAALPPRITPTSLLSDGLRAQVEQYPKLSGRKGVLRRTVQVIKRHRDQYFANAQSQLAPISVVLTTLISQSYERCVTTSDYDSEFDLLGDVVRSMPAFIERRTLHGHPHWYVWNETTEGENFAEKWKDSRLEPAFRNWHDRVVKDLADLLASRGVDKLAGVLSRSFGDKPAGQAISSLTQRVSDAREADRLSVLPAVGVGVGSSAPATPVRRNTFYGGGT